MLHIGVLFGGKSGEHEVSLVSGTTVMANLDPARYRVSAIGIRKDGSLAAPDEARRMLRRPLPHVACPEVILRSASAGRFLEIAARSADGAETAFDVLFPVLHGTYGEDGTIQGLLDMAEVPCVGCGVLGSAAGMDKEIMKQLFAAAGLPLVPHRAVTRGDWRADAGALERRLIEALGLPLFVKPARLGSSVGISKVRAAAALGPALALAFDYDYKVIVEWGVPAREIECSVMGNQALRASLPGEILPSNEWYDYNAKYVDNRSDLLLPAPLDPALTERVRELAVRALAAIGGEGYGRVDFLLDRDTGDLYVNEINTIPGFTEISMFPKLWGVTGVPLSALLDELVRLALERHAWRAALRTSYGDAS